MLKRILHFQKHDWKHIFWLIGRIFKGLWCSWYMTKEAWFLLKLHLTCDSQLVEEEENKDEVN